MIQSIGMTYRDEYMERYSPHEMAKLITLCFDKIYDIQEKRKKIKKIQLFNLTLYIEVEDIVFVILATIGFSIILFIINAYLESISG